MKYIMLLTAVLLLSGCGVLVDENEAIQTLSDAGYTKIEVLDKHIFFVGWYGCSDEDHAAFDCRAVNPVGKQVDVVVCASGLLKGSTIRH